jgi:hypothetical protein
VDFNDPRGEYRSDPTNVYPSDYMNDHGISHSSGMDCLDNETNNYNDDHESSAVYGDRYEDVSTRHQDDYQQPQPSQRYNDPHDEDSYPAEEEQRQRYDYQESPSDVDNGYYDEGYRADIVDERPQYQRDPAPNHDIPHSSRSTYAHDIPHSTYVQNHDIPHSTYDEDLSQQQYRQQQHYQHRQHQLEPPLSAGGEAAKGQYRQQQQQRDPPQNQPPQFHHKTNNNQSGRIQDPRITHERNRH